MRASWVKMEDHTRELPYREESIGIEFDMKWS